MRKFLITFFSALILLLISSVIWLYNAFYHQPISTQKKPLAFVIAKGETTTQIVEQLNQQGMTQQTYYLLLLAKRLGKLDHAKAGEYAITANATLPQLLAKLQKGQVVLHKITFPEGSTFEQMLNKLAAEPKLSHTLNTHDYSVIMTTIGHAGEYPEGLFFPDTYLFTLNTKDTQILKLAYDLMQKKLTQAWTNRATDLPYATPYEALIVASLIEKETRLAAERPMVAGVILRRLNTGMRLQIDAAVLYGLGDKNQLTLRRSDLITDTPYNTYTENGLPPTPIAMPGIAAINAALHPASGTALYYVAKGDGGHVFSDTLQQHNIAVQAYRKIMAGRETEGADYLQPDTTTIDASLQCFSAQLMQNFWRSLSKL